MLMIDRVTHVLPRGGAHGLGLLIGEKSLERDHWYFPCHFKNDQVMAGSLVSDGCSQLLKLYMIHMGLHTAVHGVVFTPVHKQPNKVRDMPRGADLSLRTRMKHLLDASLTPP